MSGHITIESDDARAVIAPIGATLVRLELDGRDVIAGPGRAAPALGHHGAVLAPWPNRTAGGRYRFGGREHRLAISDPAYGTAIHGLVTDRVWRVDGIAPDAVALSIEVRDEVGYPFSVRVGVDYRLIGARLRCTASWRNTGDRTAPFGMGFHPYLRPGAGSVDDWGVELAAGVVMDTDPETKLPLPVRAVTADDGLDGRAIGDARFSRAFGALARVDGVARAVVSSVDGELELEASDDFRWLQVFTADLPDERLRRAGIAIEPQTCPPNALADGTDLILLEPGQRGGGWWGLHRRPR